MPQYQGVWNLAQQAQALTRQQWVTDPLFKNTTLLLQGDGGANGAQNNLFLDTSSNQFAITRNGGNPGMTQGSFSPFSATGWSGYMGSSGATLVTIFMNGESDFAFGTGDFTIEFWVYLTPAGANQVLYDSRPSSTNGAYPTIYLNNSTNKLTYYVSTADRITQTSTFTYNTWHHVVVTRTGTSTKMFVDGIQEGSTYTDSTTYLNGANRPLTTNGFSNIDGTVGYISNLRIVKGSGPYQGAGSSIIVPTSPLTPVTNTVLLTLQSNRFVDTNTQVAAKTVNVSNNPSIQAFSPFAPQYQYTPTVTGGSGYFDGTGDYLSCPSTTGAPFDFGTGNFTIEGWFYATGTGASATNSRNLWGISQGGGASQKISCYIDANANLTVDVNGSAAITTGAGYGNNNFPGRWVHFALVRSGTGTNQTVLYVNGASAGTATVTTNFTAFTNPFNVGYVGEAFLSPWLGYISNFRVVKGTAVYTGAFTPPIAPLSTSGAASASAYSSTTNVNISFAASNTSLLLNFTNAGILDGTMKNNLETVSNAQVSTSVVKYGSGSMYFDGTGDWLVYPRNWSINANENFTMEAWIYLTVLPTTLRMILSDSNAGGSKYWNISSTGMSAQFGGTSATSADGAFTFAINTWYHVAVVRNSNTVSMYVNGSSITVTNLTQSTAFLETGTVLYVGRFGGTTTYEFNGYIDDLRVTKGIARYTRNFTPPQVALPRQ